MPLYPRGYRMRWSRTQVWIAGLLLLAGWAGQCWLRLRGPRFMESWPPPGTLFENWQPVAAGVEYTRANLTAPRRLKAHAVRIDLGNPQLELVVNPSREQDLGWVRSDFPSSWLRSLDALACVNATPFSPTAIFPKTRVRMVGLSISSGVVWSPKVPNLDALVLTKTGKLDLLQGEETDANADVGVGGFLVTLRNGVNLGETQPQEASTVIGYSADNRWMYWLVVDGGQPGYSEGATPHEAAELIRRLGASNALNMDSGSASILVTKGGWLGPEVRNRPRHPAYAGMQRPVGNVLAVRLRKASE